jgi:hypothetical protein
MSQLTTKELAERWGMRPQTLRRMRMKRRGPPHIKDDGRVRYNLTDIEDYEKSKRVEVKA